MHYHYFTLEQRDHLEQAIRDLATCPTELQLALDRLHSPDYGTCDACGTDIDYVEMIEAPALTLCPACRANKI
jgi:RNA polymerase-binding transcription factor DksA